MRRVLGVFAKEPRPGEVKTRLAAALGPELAARLYDAFLRDLLPRLESLPAHRVLAYSPATGKEYFERLAGDGFELEQQSGGDLGQRMSMFFQRQFDLGAGQVVLIGSDAPDLPLDRIQRAFAELTHHELVLGPSNDGGYYLIGMRRMVAEVFEGIHWSTAQVLEQTLRQVDQLAIPRAILDCWSDVDDGEDVRRLTEQIKAVRAAGMASTVPHTEAILRCVTLTRTEDFQATAQRRNGDLTLGHSL